MTINLNTGYVPPWHVGDRMRKALDHSQVSVHEMADHLGVSRNTVGNWLAGRTIPRRAFVLQWAMRTGVSAQWLATGEPPAGNDPDGGQGARSEGFEPPTF